MCLISDEEKMSSTFIFVLELKSAQTFTNQIKPSASMFG